MSLSRGSLSRVAYFSMEIELAPDIPTYSGGLGVLAGDTVRAAADLGLPMVAVSLVYRSGYVHQTLDAHGNQHEQPQVWQPGSFAQRLEPAASVVIEGRRVLIQAWRYRIRGATGYEVPVYLLDTDVEGNSPWDRSLTAELYGGDSHYRLCQETVLGMGGVRMLRRLGYSDIDVFHMNEGHAALLSLALLEEQLGGASLAEAREADIEQVRRRCVFTTHTPVPAGHDQFSRDLMVRVLGQETASVLQVTGCCLEGTLNMTYLALRFSRYVNGVALRHGEISQGMFPGYPVHAITNGVHAATWAVPAIQQLFDRQIPGWREDNAYLRYAIKLSSHDILEAHRAAKRELLEKVRATNGVPMHQDWFTIGFARRATPYKRPDLILSDEATLRRIATERGPIQILFAGKAHPRDDGGREMIRAIHAAAARLNGDRLRITYVANYDATWGRLLTGGVDLWLNTPRKPLEASGTSGMKAAVNGVPSLSILDGWWVEGCVEGITGWAIDEPGVDTSDSSDAGRLYAKLDQVILPMYYGSPERYAEIMRWAIALNGSFFNTLRMLRQYYLNAYSAEKGTADSGNSAAGPSSFSSQKSNAPTRQASP